jgi:lipase maturation factor 1
LSRLAPTTHALTRWLFLRLLAVVFLIAFVSYWVQLDGLIGSKGILPAADLMKSVRGLGASGLWRAPTLCWLSASDAFLHSLAGAGTFLSLLLFAGMADGPVLLLLWAIYLSLVVAGQVFFSFQWDILLLETALTSTLLAAWTPKPLLPSSKERVPLGGLWLVRALLFKLMFLSGITKLICLDPTWWSLTALDYHYVTQPLPVWTSYYAHHLPHGFQRASVAVMFVIELGVPFLLFMPRRLRIAGALAVIGFMGLIAGTGNYGFFNLLTAVLCVTWLDDAFLVRLVPGRWRTRLASRLRADPPAAIEPERGGATRARRLAYAIVVAAVAYASSLAFVEEMVRTRPPGRIHGLAGRLLDGGAAYVDVGSGFLTLVAPFRSISGYGLFRSMTTSRPEIAIETSDDARSWHEVAFPYKAGDVHRRPRFVAPHQPRLDWQMWFAALDPRGAEPWLVALLRRILEGSPPVVRLLDDPTLLSKPPRYVRLVMYEYGFTAPEEAAAVSGAWWTRERRGELTPALSLDSFSR